MTRAEYVCEKGLALHTRCTFCEPCKLFVAVANGELRRTAGLRFAARCKELSRTLGLSVGAVGTYIVKYRAHGVLAFIAPSNRARPVRPERTKAAIEVERGRFAHLAYEPHCPRCHLRGEHFCVPPAEMLAQARITDEGCRAQLPTRRG